MVKIDVGFFSVIDCKDDGIKEHIENPDKIVIEEEKIYISFNYPLSTEVAFKFENKGGF